MRLWIHSGAKRDVAEAAYYYESQKDRLGEQFADEVQETFRQLVEVTCAGPEFFPGHRFRVTRKFRYVVIYRVEGDLIRVMAVAHPHRDLSSWQHRVAD